MREPRAGGARRLLVVGVVVVVAAAAASSAWALTRSSGPSYRTATVTHGTVDQTLTTTGELSPMRYADDDFQVAGKVATVDVKVGDRVAAGATLAHLHRATLQAALRTAKAGLSSARERLQQDESGEASAAGSTASTVTNAASDVSYRAATVTSSPHPAPSGSPGGSGGNPTGPGAGGGHRVVTAATLRADQRAVVRAQHAVDRDLANAKVALKTESTACAGEAGSSPGTTGGTTASTSVTLSCTAAAQSLLHDQQVVSADESSVNQAEQVLSADLSTAEKSLETQGNSGSTTTGSGNGGRSTSGGSTTTVTAADLASDQATIDTERAQVATARSDLAQATLHATISGTVAAVTIGKGDSVSGSSSATSPAFEIIGSHQDKATVYVSDTQVRRMKVGQTARIIPDGTSRSVSGRVVAIGGSGTESDSGAISYPVTVDVADPSDTIVAGADAAVSITLSTASNVLAVPTSAVHYQGATAYVDLLRNGKSIRHTVTVGAVGPALTEVTAGLSEGQRVILADLNASVPSSSSTLTGRFGGGGFGPGGGFAITRLSSGGGKGGFTQNGVPAP